MAAREILGFGAKNDLIGVVASDRNVLHLGAVGETCENTEVRVQRAPDSLHAYLTRISKSCVGVDHDRASVELLRERGIFDNILCADVTGLSRSEIPLPSVDVIIAGDTIEHLGEPGKLLEVARALSDRGTKLIITTPNAYALTSFLKNVRGRELEGADHVCSFNAFTLGNIVERYGYRVEQMWTCYQPKAAQLNNAVVMAVGKRLFEWMPRLGGTLLVVCSSTSESG